MEYEAINYCTTATAIVRESHVDWTYPIVCQILLVLSEAEVDILLLCGIRVRPAVAGMMVTTLGRSKK